MSQDESSESPHLEAKLSYEKDLWGKAAYYGKPRGFVAQVNAAWQRTNVAQQVAAATVTWGQNGYGAAAVTSDHAYLNHWALQGVMFIPVIPTTSANLAGTASLLTQWSVGQGQSFVLGTWLTDDSFYQVRTATPGGVPLTYDRILTSSVTGFVQGQYYFNNEWFLTGAWGFMRNFGLGFDRVTPGGAFKYAGTTAAQANAGNNDLTKYSNQLNLALWYRPIEAIKFGVNYVYTHDVYFQKVSYNSPAGTFQNGVASPNTSRDTADNHRLEFVGFYYF
jgi:hypothetical protein